MCIQNKWKKVNDIKWKGGWIIIIFAHKSKDEHVLQ